MYIVCIDNVVRESKKRSVFSYITYKNGEKRVNVSVSYENELTIGKTYYCIGNMMGETLLGVIDNNGNSHYITKELFITVEENRDKKIKDILNQTLIQLFSRIFVRNKKNMENTFTPNIKQTANDYDMEIQEVERIARLYPNEFYEKLEEYITYRANNQK